MSNQEQQTKLDGGASVSTVRLDDLVQALYIAANAIDAVYCDGSADKVCIDVPHEWGLPGGGGNPKDGWCSTYALAEKLREIADAGSNLTSPTCSVG